MAGMVSAVQSLERDFASWLSVPAAIATGFGRSAAFLAVQAVAAMSDGNARASEVLVPDFICCQIPEAVRLAGATPRYYRVPRDLMIRPEHVRGYITPITSAVLVPHYFGRVQPHITELARACDELAIVLIEDCALALRATSLQGQLAGTFGGLAVFSLTKSDWCYGGGLLAAREIVVARCARALLASKFTNAPRLAWAYGLLRRADCASNRPTCARIAELAGRRLERFCGMRGGNFYGTGRFDTSMPAFAARRARRLLQSLPDTVARRRQILAAFYEALRDTPFLFRPEFDPGDVGSFLLLHAPGGNASDWREQAAAAGVTLRLVWPAYQEPEPTQASADLGWLAGHLLFLEIHPQLSEDEVAHIVRILKNLAGHG